MNEINKVNLSEQTKIQLSEIIITENCFHQEINQRKSYSKKLSKYITAFGYIDKILIVLSATTGGVWIISFTSIVGAPVGIASPSFTLIFSLTTGIVKKLLNITRNKKKKHDKIFMLVKSKLNSIETLSQEEFVTILKEKDKCETMKDNLKTENEKYKIMSLTSVRSKI